MAQDYLPPFYILVYFGMVDKIRTWQFSWVSWYPRFDPSTISRHQAGSPDLSPPEGAEPKRAALGRELRGLGFQWSPEKFASDTNLINGFGNFARKPEK